MSTSGSTVLLAVAMGMASALSAAAFEVSPIRATLGTAGTAGSVVLRVENADPGALPIEVTLERRDVAEDGTQSLTPADGDFVVFPPQALVPAGQSQAFRVQYVGPATIPTSVAYVANVSQVPVQQPGGSGVIVVYRFGVALYVVPDDALSDPVVVSAEAEGGRLRLAIRNEGTRHALLSNDRIEIGDIVLDGESLSSRVANPIMPPGGTRIFDLTVPGLPSQVDASSIRYRPRED
ncbi:MAG: hypothetical protein AAF899_04520 [Pseudomonadota bacterium]